MKLSEKIIEKVLAIEPEKRRVYAARLLTLSLIGWCLSHIILVVIKESSFFNHTMLAISWIAIGTTSIDIILTTDVRAENES